MSYQVLARKWRPSSFSAMVGQEHVLRALVNALDDDRLHHAYLFTGTRGVGKTSLARLFAKSLNCEQGVSSSPCGHCSPCQEIAEGRFVDLIEVDAASRTKVEDTRELLENVQYAPTRGRYKIYLIDEVHMLSSHSFNALLKTLEEPPPHVKFLLATTDPQKLPVTILSRCLQFNLKNMTPERITGHLQQVLAAEQISFDEPALWLLSRAADGSMRDALSLTDQAIAFGAGAVRESDVRAMLGSIDQGMVCRLLQAVGQQDAEAVLATVAQLAEHAPDYDGVLAELISLLHRVAVAQLLPGSIDNSLGDQAEVTALAQTLRAEDVQLYYQVALNGRRDLPLVPNPRDGLEMALLRMLAFRPVGAGELAVPQQGAGRAVAAPHRATAAATAAAEDSAPAQSHPGQPEEPSVREGARGDAPATPSVTDRGVAPSQPAPGRREPAEAPPWDDAPPAEDEPPPWGEPQPRDEPQPRVEPQPHGSAPASSQAVGAAQGAATAGEASTPPKPPRAPLTEPSPPLKKPDAAPAPLPGPAAESQGGVGSARARANPSTVPQAPVALEQLTPAHWVAVLDQLELAGMTYTIAANAALVEVRDNRLSFELAEGQMHLLTATHEQRITRALEGFFKTAVEINVIAVPAISRETPRQYHERRRAERLAEAVSAMEQDEVVQSLLQRFDGDLDRASIQPVDPD